MLLAMGVSKLAIEELKGELLDRDLSILFKIKIDLVIRLSDYLRMVSLRMQVINTQSCSKRHLQHCTG